jgi:hypothetical protein
MYQEVMPEADYPVSQKDLFQAIIGIVSKLYYIIGVDEQNTKPLKQELSCLLMYLHICPLLKECDRPG